MSGCSVVRGVSCSYTLLLIAAFLGACAAAQSLPGEPPDAAFTTQSAMHLMYGNYNQADDSSYLRLSPAKEGLRSKFQGDLEASAVLDTAYVEAGIARRLLVTTARPVGVSWECHGCSLLVGAAVFSKSKNGWSLTARRFALTEAGEFAEDPLVTLQPLGPDHFGFRLEDNFSGGGTGTGFALFDISGSEIKEVLSAAKDSNFMGDECWPMPLSQAWHVCVAFTGGISVVPGDDPEHYDIVLTRRVTSSLTRRIPRGTYQLRYQYTAGKYILKESSPLKPADYDSRP
jgi:hypothetical protein